MARQRRGCGLSASPEVRGEEEPVAGSWRRTQGRGCRWWLWLPGSSPSMEQPWQHYTIQDLSFQDPYLTSLKLPGIDKLVTSTVGKSTNILWHDCPIGQFERQKLLNQKGCVVWITGLSGSGKSTLACALSRELHSRGHLTYILDGDNLRHGLNRDLCFEAKDRAENIRRVGEVAKLFADAGLICIASLISPYRSERSACRKLLHNSTFIEVFLNVPLEVCEARDPKGLYKLARAGKIKGFTGIDDPYEPPSDCEIVIQCKAGDCATPKSMADQVVSYLEANEFLQD
ncbi:Adenylyl-sulfate kinase, chloroplastic [Triticum urartu]|uniref:Adenylyl-sulfate kinase n=1 Tax=Triticum urartu TaxID=4572 RepID=M7ZW22_TRIUA|nr:Adenylyl-sulfate kinase, chloroplastic [Triticum urartu]